MRTKRFGVDAIKKESTVKTVVHNNTSITREQIEARPLLGIIKNNWRQRMVKLYRGDEATKVYMVGVSFDNTIVVLSHEEVGMNEGIAMDYWQHGKKTYTRD